jgi:hypothetical protein
LVQASLIHSTCACDKRKPKDTKQPLRGRIAMPRRTIDFLPSLAPEARAVE